MLFEASFGLGAVEEHVGNFFMSQEEGVKIVGNQRIALDVRVKTAFPDAGLQYVPYRYPGAFNQLYAFLVGSVRIHLQKLRHDAPKTVLRMGIILMRLE